ncbi:MAG TPA: MYXO-CTERM sorting domain-containing protein [Polyangiaceae bacterium]|nr:MYXO-CTERM sorting domain-containing protein [Polyangiaceae bacterium]
MRKSLLFVPSLLAGLGFASSAGATTWYVTPDGTATDGCFSRDYAPCDLGTASNNAVAGDTVILGDGVYTKQLYVSGTGTSSAWLTFQADDCATPIIEGPGVAPDADNQDAGVSSSVATYVKFVGIVSTGWSTGFGNGWVDTDATTSNGHFEYDNCLADGNGRTGFTFYSAQGIKIKNSIAAHNGSSTLHSWSSGITLYEAQGSASDSWIEGNISFENMDNQKHTDGSGFIIDEYSKGATFINNVAFRNGGSCLRLTESANTVFVNNTCYHDAQDMADTGPTNPSEVYFTKASDGNTTTGTTFMNDVFVATGVGPGMMAIYNQPTTGWANNSVTNSGSVSFFTDAEGTNPNFTLASGSMLAAKGGTGSSVPTTDVGFDPKCITKKAPTPIGMMGSGSWWQYSVDLDYIKSLGGVAKCFNPKMRSGTPDIGAYSNGAVTTTTAGTCTKPPPFGTMQGPGLGAGGAGGMSSGAGGMSTGAGGMATSAGGSAGAVSTGGTTSSGGTTSMGAGGTSNPSAGAPAAGGTTGSGTGGTTATGSGGTASGTGGTGGTTSTSAGGTTSTGTGGTAAPGTGGASGTTSASAGSSGSDNTKSGCGCRVAGDEPNGGVLALAGLVGLAGFGVRRRRAR